MGVDYLGLGAVVLALSPPGQDELDQFGHLWHLKIARREIGDGIAAFVPSALSRAAPDHVAPRSRSSWDRSWGRCNSYIIFHNEIRNLLVYLGGPDRTRTCGLRFRKPLLCPAELRDPRGALHNMNSMNAPPPPFMLAEARLQTFSGLRVNLWMPAFAGKSEEADECLRNAERKGSRPTSALILAESRIQAFSGLRLKL